jgi:riboflavin kinase/FMN adenylyltransferase
VTLVPTALQDAPQRPRRLAVGEFDGVHVGHREVIRGADAVLTFEPHPRAVITPDAAPKLLTTLDVKAELVESLGVSELVVIHFDREFAALSPEAFIDDVLVRRLGATHVSVGENFRFGHRARGDAAMLAAHPGFETRVAPLVEADGEIVSSSRIRGLIAAGDIEHANHFLGAPFQLRGAVVAGDRRGRELGVPTANVVPDERLAYPGHGVYAARANGDVAAAVNVGVRPQFQTGRGTLIEAHLIDWDGDLYDSELKLEFLGRLRGERRFPTVDALVEQMRRDIDATRAIATG